MEPDDTFAGRVSLKFSNLSEVATRLGPSQTLSSLLLQQLPKDRLHIIVQMPSGTNSDDIAIPLPSVSPLTQIVPSKRSSSTCPENDLPLKKSRNSEWLRRSSCYHPTHFAPSPQSCSTYLRPTFLVWQKMGHSSTRVLPYRNSLLRSAPQFIFFFAPAGQARLFSLRCFGKIHSSL